MKIYLILTLLAFATLTLGSDDKLTTTATSALISTITNGQRIRGYSTALATPLQLPEWELKNRDRWIPMYNGRPCPNEDGCQEPANVKPIKNTQHTWRASAVNPSTTNVRPGVSQSSAEITQFASGATHHSSATASLIPDITAGPHPNQHELLRRQAIGPVYIPYIPADWSTITQCPAVAGLPCATVSQYIPFLKQDAARASEEAARASWLANNGAFVPGMKVPAGVRMVEVAVAFVVALFVAATMAITMVM